MQRRELEELVDSVRGLLENYGEVAPEVSNPDLDLPPKRQALARLDAMLRTGFDASLLAVGQRPHPWPSW